MIIVSLVYPADPIGVIPGEFGIDSFIRSLIRYAPEDIRYEFVGITTDPAARPVGKWSDCTLGDKHFRLFPVLTVRHSGKRSPIPLSFRFTLNTLRLRPKIQGHLLEFHRIEPSLAFLRDRRPKNAFIHQDMRQLRNPHSDIIWRHMPTVFFKLEDSLLPRFDSLFTVSEAGYQDYRDRYPAISERFHYTPTFMNPEIFRPPSQQEQDERRLELRQRYDLSPQAVVCVTVGRLDQQKDPVLLIDAFARAAKSNEDLFLLLIGDGLLRSEVELQIAARGIEKRCRLLGLLPPTEIAGVLQGADLFLLTSAYEGMPIALLEALACGLPAVGTAVGEVPKLIDQQVGELVAERSPERFAEALLRVSADLANRGGAASLAQAEKFTPARVLVPVYENYRRLAGQRGPESAAQKGRYG